ncbi:DUF6641 family protein [Spiribacter roseus]|uniref:DUF6641 family protein n=1 Tax=Spiribacter roseus TaxID=1855875 RepID=UPI00133089AD|nr:DUF6641 family protein [Spiribacter roseus]KAF0282282.1 hypothetical protein BA900_07175 [Spiribacter roseus]
MTVLNTLTFAKYTVANDADPVTKRRNKLLQKIDEQILLATDDTYTPTKRVCTTDAAGNTRTIDKPKRVKRWWSVQTDGKVLLTVRYGARAIEFQKGKDAIEVESVEALPAMLRTVRHAVADGELDELLAKYAQYGRAVKKK